MKKIGYLFFVCLMLFFIVSCKSDVKENYEETVKKYTEKAINESGNAIEDFTKIYDDAIGDVIEDAEELMDKATQEIEKVMNEYK